MSGRIFVRGETYWMSFRVTALKDGKPRRIEVRETTRVRVNPAHPEKSKRAAWGVLKDRLRQITHPTWVGPYNEKLTVKDLLDAYTTLRLPVVKNPHAITFAVQFLVAEFGVVRASCLLPESVDAWRVKMTTAGYAEGTVDRIARVLRAAYNLALRDRKVAFVPRISMYAPDDARQGFVEPDEFWAIHRALDALEPVIADLWLFGYYSGRRPSELERIQWADVSLDQRTATIARSKNRRPWIVALEGPLWEVIERRQAAKTREGMIVPFVFHLDGQRIDANRRNKVFAKARTAAGYPTRIWYDLRRTAVRDLINAGVDPTTVMATAGHTTTAMMQRYGIRTDADLRRAQQRLYDARQNRGQFAGHWKVIALPTGTDVVPR